MRLVVDQAQGLGRKAWWLLGLMILAGALPAEAALCRLAWDANGDNTAGYRVYHSYSSNGYTEGSYSFSTNATSMTCEEMGIGLDGRMHYWTVTAFNAAGRESAFASEVWMQMPLIAAPAPAPPPPPPAPTCLRIAFVRICP